MLKPLLVILLGPTAVGKTSLAIALAKRFNTVIFSADSRQLYKEIPIGTAQPTPEEIQEVAHFFIASSSINEHIDAGRYGKEARELLISEFKKHAIIIMAGGSGLYMDAVINGFDELPDANPTIRAELNLEFQEKGISVLQDELKKLDPIYFAQVDKHNPARLMRAIEICRLSEKKYSELRLGKAESNAFEVLKIGLDLPREELYARINNRVEVMFENGLEEEARSVFPYRKMNALQTVGYKELFDYFDGHLTKEKAIELIKQHSRNYAKRQLTWWRRDTAITWFNPTQLKEIEILISQKVI
ncbi:MAG: tRNA (adenosine(37)-N6)-dimethylallyltransferase MiaA [Bacteroidetes bacterium]|nr:tRNA (adenosine(37)-N6)-dimethylallyltransferase MiaA [Bacteroidota bacterium]PHX83261.1 MAG: tRNA (adenosine(37)-N6)-dimethylallyltransferase MiaA [Flavobacteriales bacterium]